MVEDNYWTASWYSKQTLPEGSWDIKQDAGCEWFRYTKHLTTDSKPMQALFNQGQNEFCKSLLLCSDTIYNVQIESN